MKHKETLRLCAVIFQFALYCSGVFLMLLGLWQQAATSLLLWLVVNELLKQDFDNK